MKINHEETKKIEERGSKIEDRLTGDSAIFNPLSSTIFALFILRG
jgi:hypothetical protein